jgi:hypothetical protein
MLRDVTIARGRNVNEKEAKKILQSKDLTTQIQCQGNVENKSAASNNGTKQNKVVPVIMEPSQTHS